MPSTIIIAECGNITYVKGHAPHEIEPILANAVHAGTPFIYLASDGAPPNSLAVAPNHVVALVRHDD